MTLDAKLLVKKVNSAGSLQLESRPVSHTVETELLLSVNRQLETVTMEIKIHSMAAINARLPLDGSAEIRKTLQVMLLELQGLFQFVLLHVEIVNLTLI
jgi:hypothetical protein